MKIKPIITGSTGLVGKGLLLECLDNDNVESVLVINRNSVGIEHPKLKEIICPDLFNLSTLEPELEGYDTCFFCLGISSIGIKEEKYRHITYDLTLNFARALLKISKAFTFCYISGAGTDSSEKGRIMWARVKGKTENDLLKLPFKSAYMFRTALIMPKRGIKSRTKSYNVIYTLTKPLYPLLKKFPKIVTNTTILSRAMIYVATNGYSKKIIENTDINSMIH